MLRTNSIFMDFDGIGADEPGAIHFNGLYPLAGPCPCDGCPQARRCADGLACPDFAYYVSTGRVRHARRVPGGDLFRRMFEAEEILEILLPELEKVS
jgi:hypothetical protein